MKDFWFAGRNCFYKQSLEAFIQFPLHLSNPTEIETIKLEYISITMCTFKSNSFRQRPSVYSPPHIKLTAHWSHYQSVLNRIIKLYSKRNNVDTWLFQFFSRQPQQLPKLHFLTVNRTNKAWAFRQNLTYESILHIFRSHWMAVAFRNGEIDRDILWIPFPSR